MIIERNLNPKAACLRRRTEEKSDDHSGNMNLLPTHDQHSRSHFAQSYTFIQEVRLETNKNRDPFLFIVLS